MLNRQLVSASAALAALAFILAPAGFAAAAGLIATSTTVGTDDLIGATGASWTFTASTTGQIGGGNMVEFIAPAVNMAVPFGVGTPAVASSTNIYHTRHLHLDARGRCFGRTSQWRRRHLRIRVVHHPDRHHLFGP